VTHWPMIITAKAPSLSFMGLPYRGLGEAVTLAADCRGRKRRDCWGSWNEGSARGYVEFIGAKKHLVLGLSSNTGPLQGSATFANG